MDRNGELSVLDKYRSLKVDLLKAGHHGSKTASDPTFIKEIDPKMAWISAGRNNRYHHPNEETLKTFRGNQVKVFNTQTLGMVKYDYRNNQNGNFAWKLQEKD